MNKLVALVQTAGDRMNPVAVKEFRQAVQSRGAMIILVLFLLVNLSVVGGYVMLASDADTSIDGGRKIFMGLLCILQFTCMVITPLYSGSRMSQERNNTEIDLLYVTTLTPGAIVRGKYLTATALTLLIFSASMPFMILTYLLRGIDLPTIFLLLAMSFLICAAANAVGIAAGCLPAKGSLRGISILALFFLLPSFPGVMAHVEYLIGSGIGGMIGTRQFWAVAGTYVIMASCAIGLLHVLSVALLSPKPSNRMLVPRLFMTASWAITGVTTTLWSYFGTTLTPIIVWTVCCGVALMILMVVSMGERDTWTARVRRTIPRNWLLRPLAFLFYTGSAGGLLWCVLLFTATMLVACKCRDSMSVMAVGRGDLADVCSDLPIVFGYVLCYCLTTAFFRIAVLRNVPTISLPVLAAFFGMAASLGPYLIVFIADANMWFTTPWYLLCSPLVLTSYDTAVAPVVAPVVLGWIALSVLLSAPWFIGQWRRFAPYQTQPAGTTEA